MSSRKIAKSLGGKVKPILSIDQTDARRRVLNLYRSWYRQIPYICYEFDDIPINAKQMRAKVREIFFANRHITDIRVIDMHVVRGQMELNDTVNKFKTLTQVMAYFKDPYTQQPKDFLSKFLSGHNNE